MCSVWTPLSHSWIPCGSCLQGFCGTRALLSLALMSFTTRQFPTQQHCQAVSQLTLLGSVLLSLRVAYLNSYTHPAPPTLDSSMGIHLQTGRLILRPKGPAPASHRACWVLPGLTGITCGIHFFLSTSLSWQIGGWSQLYPWPVCNDQ